ncbi:MULTISPECIES: DUF2306 domain-containing protein [Mameliella]|nr:DUF2306 domain-containing protein [Mameliella sp. LZ-28]MCR9273273.1 DUF2306 domain-containing protein [Paracoccaceae bacterium]OWV58351.1 DUF2306 domain-containing protein [Mameliella alba]
MIRRALPSVLLVLLALMVLPFAWHALTRPVLALQGVPEALGRLFHPGAPLSNLAIYAHMITGAVITATVPLQLLPVIRRRAPGLHRLSGYTLATTAVVTGLAGLLYIALQGTVGGPWMSGWFALYGALMILAASNTVYYAIDKDVTRHRRWALRLMVLAVGSYFYRLHYGLWFATTGGIGVDDFYGPFDRAMVWAFYLPYLALLELWFLGERRLSRKPA